MAEPDNDPNAGPDDLEDDAHAPSPAPYQPPGNPAPHPHPPIRRNVDQPKQTPAPAFTDTAQPAEPAWPVPHGPTPGANPEPLP